MKSNDGNAGDQSAHRPDLSPNAQEFQGSLERRRVAADGLENDLLNDVPLLYGSPDGIYGGKPTEGDPGIVLARIHREQMLRRHGYDVSDASGPRSEISLPYERLTAALAVLLFLIVWLARLS